ncbi:MAG: endonuclease/exonuclease/phosphatase family protein [Cetobacterium sp.]
MGTVMDNHIRVGSINLNNTLQNAEGDESLFRAIQELDIKILCMQEVGCNWSNLPRKQAFQQRLDRAFGPGETKSCCRHNVHDMTGTTRQWGGTGLMCKGKTRHYAMGVGGDKTGLGRWTWARIRGKGGIVFRYVSVYCPCDNREGKIAVWSQHKVYLQNHNDDREPRKAFLEDLKKEIQRWREEGDQILICGDLNHDVSSPTIVAFFEELEMSNLIYERHEGDEAPSTYYRGNTGSVVDGIWGTPGLAASYGGYLRPGEFPGDHSLLWVDISYQAALGHDPPIPQNPDARRLRLSDTPCVKRYLSAYKRLIQGYNLLQRQFRLESETKPGTPLTQEQIQEYEAIDRLKTRCMLQAEKRCRKLKRGGVSFSEETITPLRLIAWWNVAIKRRQGKQVHPKVWRRKKKEAGLQALRTSEMTLSDMIQSRKQAVKAFRQAKKNHEEHRVAHINKMPKKVRDRLLRIERQRKMAKVAKAINGKLANKSITKVEYEGQEYTTQEDIEKALLQVNENKTRASDNTPFMQGELLRDFGYRQNTAAHEEVLQGTYKIPETCHPATERVLRGLARPSSTRESKGFRVRTHITTEDHIKGWKRQKERTSGGMSGLHFGHYKAHLQDKLLAAFDASMRSVAYTTGYALSRWKKGLDVQLLKKTNDFKATNLRTILLLEPDHNMNNKVIGNDAMRAGERLAAHARDNYGSRKGLRAAEVSMNQTLTYNSIWARRGRAVIMSNDAKGCYDRIAHTVVNLALQRLGVPKPAVQSMLTVIQEMEHHIRTAFGDSKGTYGNNSRQPPPQGILQGSGAGPAGWAAIAAVIIKAMKDEGFGYKVWTLIRQRAVEIVGFAFVDDTDLIHAAHDRKTPTQRTLQEAQAALSLWENMLHATGGALAPEKSYWYLVEVARKKGKWTYQREKDHPFDLFLAEGTAKVERLEVYQAKKALGILARPDGKMTDEIKELQRKIRSWCDGIRTKRIHPEEAWYSLNATIMKTLEYPLTATTFTQKQCKDLLRPVLKTALPLCRIQRRMPRDLVHGSLRVRGLNIPNLYWTQLIHHLHSIQRHMHRNTPSRDLHEENMDLVQFHVGSTVNFWDLPFEEYGHLAPEGWMKHTWQALDQTALSLQGPQLGLPNERQGDVALMDAFVAQGYDAKTLTTLNECRFWLAASHISHISTACGIRIDRRCWDGKQHRADMRPKLIHTHRPTKTAWEIWRAKLREMFLVQGATHLRLRTGLGTWLKQSSPTWKWWKHQPSQTLYEKCQDGS